MFFFFKKIINMSKTFKMTWESHRCAQAKQEARGVLDSDVCQTLHLLLGVSVTII